MVADVRGLTQINVDLVLRARVFFCLFLLNGRSHFCGFFEFAANFRYLFAKTPPNAIDKHINFRQLHLTDKQGKNP
jgi:hypothetical protein